MIKTAFTFSLSILTLISAAQGSWNIGYIPVDSISQKDINREIKIDFKYTSRQYVEKTNRSVRYFISSQDTGRIMIEGKTVDLVEIRKIYADLGSYKEQYLECYPYGKNQLLRIYDSEIVEVTKDSILFRMHVEIYYKQKGKTRGEPVLESVRCWIEKNKLDGVMIII